MPKKKQEPAEEQATVALQPSAPVSRRIVPLPAAAAMSPVIC